MIEKLFRYGGYPAIAAYRCQGTAGLGQQYVVTLAIKPVLVLDPGACELGGACFEPEDIIIFCRCKISNFQLGHYQKRAGLFHLAIACTILTKQLGAAHLKIYRILTVVHVAHLVSFDVSYPQLNFTAMFVRSIVLGS